MKITLKVLAFLMGACDVLPNEYSAKPLGALTILWDGAIIFADHADVADAVVLRVEVQSDIKVMFSKRGIPVKE